jgi:hypothetical protein
MIVAVKPSAGIIHTYSSEHLPLNTMGPKKSTIETQQI